MFNLMQSCYPARLRFIEPPADSTPGVTPPVVPPVAPVIPPVALGFPADTPIAEMSDAEQAAYYKHHSRRHEATANARSDYDALKADSEELARLRAENATDNEKALAAARLEGKTEGSAIFLRDAVEARLLYLTGKTPEEIVAATELIDITKLTLSDGKLDLEKIGAFAGTLGTKAPADPDVPPTDTVRQQLSQQQNDPSHRAVGSIAELTKQRVAELTPSK